MQRIILLSGLLLLLAGASVWSADSQPASDQEVKTAPVKNPASPLADQIPWLSINEGGAINMGSTNYKMGVTVGQTAVGNVNGTNHDMNLGFWQGACAARPGDANASNTYTLADVIQTVNYIFNKPGCAPQPICWLSGLLCRGDWNASNSVTLSDVVQAVNFMFNKPLGPWNAKAIGACCLP